MAALFTFGHSNRDIDSLVDRLRTAGIECIVDVRAVPRSRRHPQFGYGPLGARLAVEGIRYTWQGRALGGRRREGDVRRHGGLREPALRAYAQHMESDVFAAAMVELLTLAESVRACLLCAERDPANCHRALIADWLVAHGHRVTHLLESGSREHVLHPAARRVGEVLHYQDRSTQGVLF